MMTTSSPRNERPLYRVTLFLGDGSRPQYTCRAESPEAAIRKITEREGPALAGLGLHVVHGIAELVT